MEKLHLIIELPEGKVTYLLGEVPVPVKRLPGSFYHSDKVREIESAWRRYRTKDRVSAEKAIAKFFPNFVEVQPEFADERLEDNRLCDLGEAIVLSLREYDGKFYPSMSFVERTDEQGEVVNSDGIPKRLLNCMTGEPYPSAPEGQSRYRVSISWSQGGSYSAYHELWFAADPRTAVLNCLAVQKENAAKPGSFLGMFMNGQVTMSSAWDLDTEEHFFFEGDDVRETKQSNNLARVFTGLARAPNDMSGSDALDQIAEMLDPEFRGMLGR